MPALNLPLEVFVLILKLLESRDLLQCATVCSQWKDVALDIKWREHNVELVDLLGALGPVGISPTNPEAYGFTARHSSIEDAVASGGWQRLDGLRKKITRLRIEKPLTLEDINYVMNLQHAVESPHHAFCPKLRHLQVGFDLQPQPYPYDFMAGESLIEIKLVQPLQGPDEQAAAVISTLERVAVRSPMIKDILACADAPFIDYGMFSNLRVLIHGGEFSVKSWIQLCTGCPLLEDVGICGWQDRLASKEAIHVGPAVRALPALRALYIETPKDGVLIPYVLRTTNLPELRMLEVNSERLEPAEADAIFSLVSRRSPLLEELSLTSRILEWGGFASFTGLRGLELFGDLGSFTTEHVDRIITNIPNLVRLSIGVTHSYVDRTRPAFTPAFLEAMTERCQQLYQLAIPLDALSIPETPEILRPSVTFKSLGVLTLDPLQIERKAMKPFARYLTQLCPNVKHFENTMLLHPVKPGMRNLEPRKLTRKEERSITMMKSLFFNILAEGDVPADSASEEDDISDSASEEDVLESAPEELE